MTIIYILALVLVTCSCYGNSEVTRTYEDSHPIDLVTIWGQNYAAQKTGAREPELLNLCRTSPYDVIIIGYVTRYFDTINQNGNYPGMDFSIHCKIDLALGIIQCPNIQQAIEACHENNKKVLIGIGGAGSRAEFTTFHNAKQAELLAAKIWDMFLTDDKQEYPHPRPFGVEMVDGVNIDIRHDRTQYMNVFIQRLDEFRTVQNQVEDKLITLTATCDFPNPYLGPGPGRPLGDTVVVEAIDEIFVLFTKDSCCMIGSAGFRAVMQKWNVFSAKTQTNLALGLASSKYAVRNQQCFNPAERVVSAVKNWQEVNPLLSGIFIVDNSFDIMNQRRYGYSAAIEQMYTRPQQPTMVQPLLPGRPGIVPTTLPPLITRPPPIVPHQQTMVQPLLPGGPPGIVPTTLPPLITRPPAIVLPEDEPEPVMLPTELPEEPPIDQTERPPVLQPEEVVDSPGVLEPPLEEIEEEEEEAVEEELEEGVVLTTTMRPLVNASENLIIDSTTEGKEEFDLISTTPLPPPATRAPPLLPDVADGRVPPPSSGGWGQAAEVQKDTVNCNRLDKTANENTHHKCAQPYTRKHHGRKREHHPAIQKSGKNIRYSS